MKSNKREIFIKVKFDLVDWLDNTTVPNYNELLSTLDIISLYKQNPEYFTKAQTKLIVSWLKKNSIDKFIEAKQKAEHHQALLDQDSELASEFLWVKRVNINH